jgi:hypothetical protein
MCNFVLDLLDVALKRKQLAHMLHDNTPVAFQKV